MATVESDTANKEAPSSTTVRQNTFDMAAAELAADAPDTILPIGTIICNLLKNASYLFIVLAITVLMFVQTA